MRGKFRPDFANEAEGEVFADEGDEEAEELGDEDEPGFDDIRGVDFGGEIFKAGEGALGVDVEGVECGDVGVGESEGAGEEGAEASVAHEGGEMGPQFVADGEGVRGLGVGRVSALIKSDEALGELPKFWSGSAH